MKTKTIITALAIGLSIGIVSQAGAWMGGPGHYNRDTPMMGQMMGHHNTQPLTTEQQQQIEEIEATYQDELQAKETAIRTKITDIDTAYADDNTTVAQLNTLRTDLYNLKRDYRQTRMAINTKIGDTLGSDYTGTGGWGPRYCMMDGDMPAGGPMMGMMGGNNGRHCRW